MSCPPYIVGIIKAAQERDKPGLIPSLISILGGGVAIDQGSPMARGKHRLFHGTTKNNARSIMNQGISTMGALRASGKSITDAMLDPAARRASSDMAFGTMSRLFARGYGDHAALTEKLRETGELGKKELLDAGSSLGYRLSPDHRNAVDEAKQRIKVLQLELPVTEAKRLKTNPEQRTTSKKTNDFISKLLYSHSPGIKGGVKPNEIVGGKGFKRISLPGIKARPGRALAGLGLVTGGATAASYGGKRLYDRYLGK